MQQTKQCGLEKDQYKGIYLGKKQARKKKKNEKEEQVNMFFGKLNNKVKLSFTNMVNNYVIIILTNLAFQFSLQLS